MTTTFAELGRTFEKLADGGLRRIVHRALRAGAVEAESESRVLAGTRLRVRSGYLRRSIQGVAEDGDTLSMVLRAGGGGQDVRYARLQELGGIVRPVNARMLAMPWPNGPAETRAGVARYFSPRDFPGELRFIKTARGGLLVRERGKRGRAKNRSEIIYILLHQSKVPAHYYLRDAFDKGVKEVEVALGELLTGLGTVTP